MTWNAVNTGTEWIVYRNGIEQYRTTVLRLPLQVRA